MDHRIGVAVENNARWCDLVCRSHGITTSWQEGFWVARQPSPKFYPAAITLQENVAPDRLIAGYQRGHDLDAAVRAGFNDLAALRVWVQVNY